MSRLRRFPRLPIPRCTILSLTTLLGLALTATPGSATAPSFYDPPQPLPPSENGDIVRHEPSTFHLDPLRAIEAPADAQRIMYRSTNTHDAPIAVTGTVLTPHTSWDGPGERPVVAYAPGTQGIGDQCAPSKKLAAGEQYEGKLISALLNRGYGVVVTDYEGLGTPGVHTYVNRQAQGHAVLDSLRAAQRLPEAELPEAGPVATFGYSQGGGASASAAELQPDYAPELALRGTYAGAVPADLGEVAEALDGGYSAGLVGFALAGMQSAYPELDVPGILNDRGKKMVQNIQDECIGDTARYAFHRSADLTEDGRPLADYLAEEPFKSRVAEQTIGERAPEAPVLVAHSVADDIVPYPQGREMARDWCARGADVNFSTYVTPTHVAPAVAAVPEALHFLQDRFEGVQTQDNCADLSTQQPALAQDGS